jgi:hypothetical protein
MGQTLPLVTNPVSDAPRDAIYFVAMIWNINLDGKAFTVLTGGSVGWGRSAYAAIYDARGEYVTLTRLRSKDMPLVEVVSAVRIALNQS